MTIEERFWGKVTISEGCWEWQAGKNRQGYGFFFLGDRNVAAHRLSWQFTHGEPAGDLHVLHKCDNPSCVNPDHLFLGTHQDNMADKIAKGRSNHIRHHQHLVFPWAKLNMETARQIRSEHAATGMKHKDLALRFGVSRAQVGRILAGHQWPEPEL